MHRQGTQKLLSIVCNHINMLLEKQRNERKSRYVAFLLYLKGGVTILDVKNLLVTS